MRKCLSVLAVALAAEACAAELPVREVILYKHGVGYFERAGELRPGESARLDFKAAEMNDVLKSLTVESKNGARIGGLRYDSSEPLAQRLAEFPFKLDGTPSVAAFLNQMKGARLELKLAGETLAGLIVSARNLPGSDKQPERELLVLLLDSGDLRTVDLSTASAIRFPDLAIQAQLKEYLGIVAGARSRDKRSVYIDSTDSGVRQLAASYMVPMPVWKSSYRLIFGAAGEPTLEGWAIIDNTTGEDWDKVQLALVSGRPISFVSALYEPKYVGRPTVELPEDRPQGPVVYEGVMNAPAAAPPPPPAPREALGQRGAKRAGMESGALASNELKLERDELRSTIQATTAARELGDLFEYRFSSPVTVKRGESAMLPFVQQKIGARKLLIYSDVSSAHPMNAAELSNSTGKTLDGGPITVYDANAYAGEALVETLKAGDKRLVSYGVDLGTRITTAFDSSRDFVRELHVRRGVLTARSAVQENTTYTVHNVDQKAKTLIIERAQRPEYKVLSPKPSETTRNSNRFELKLAAGATEKLAVAEERVFDNSMLITSLTPDVLYSYVQNKNISDAARAQLQQVLDRKRQIAGNDRAIERAEADINNLIRDQDRIRQNINSLNQVSGQQQQVQAYSRTLAQQESQLAALRDKSSELRNRKVALEAELSALIEKLEF